ncbi:MAG TPA: alpha/beta fold hydrolase [Acidimicrobiales bacterium]|nr:alpha/beta fold hydrolase [Acidimicrobiales bacterium]
MLTTRKWGTGSRVVLIHGFTQSAGAWAPLAARLAGDHEVVAVDAPGHGGSAGVRAGLGDGAALIADVAGRGAYVGYSMGGRFALHVALGRPDVVERLVLVSATGGIDDPAERAARVASDEGIARRVERDGVPAFLDWWLERPLFATLPPEAAALDARLGGTPEGLASSLRLAGAGRQEPLWDRLGAIEQPVLVVAGELDGAYLARAHRLVAAIGANARLAVIPGAGHACHLERPDAWLAAVGPFLAAGR